MFSVSKLCPGAPLFGFSGTLPTVFEGGTAVSTTPTFLDDLSHSGAFSLLKCLLPLSPCSRIASFFLALLSLAPSNLSAPATTPIFHLASPRHGNHTTKEGLGIYVLVLIVRSREETLSRAPTLYIQPGPGRLNQQNAAVLLPM